MKKAGPTTETGLFIYLNHLNCYKGAVDKGFQQYHFVAIFIRVMGKIAYF